MTLTADQRDVTPRRSVPRDPITRWLIMVGGLIILMVVVGGYVRLSRAGLSIVEWDVFSGILPPIGDAAWEEAFADYQQSPEYLLVNSGMTLAEYQTIYYIEWGHRLIARIVGLLVVVPLIWFMWKGLLGLRESLRYWAIAALFGLQGAIGWLMVSSGLQDRPLVSHYRLTIHLLTALALLGIVLWMALDRMEAEQPAEASRSRAGSGGSRILAWVLLGVVVAQIAYGGLVAGLRAGQVSNTWPLMFGRMIPQGLLTTAESWWASLVEPLAAHWVHRWFAFAVAVLAIAVFVALRRDPATSNALRKATTWLLIVITAQISLGIVVVLLGVPKWFALAHQGLGVILFCVALIITQGVSSRERGSGTGADTESALGETSPRSTRQGVVEG